MCLRVHYRVLNCRPVLFGDCMLQATLIMLPAFNKADFVHSAESVTGKNHLRATDAKNLPNPTAEILSILEDFAGFPDAGLNLMHFGFLFTGTTDNIDLVPSVVGGTFFRTLLSRSPILGAVIVVATLQQWESAIERVGGCDHEHLRRCFAKITLDLSKFRRRNDLLRLN